GQVTALTPATETIPNDIGHSAADFFTAYNRGANDGFDLERGAYSTRVQLFPYTQRDETSIPNYWAYASHFGLGDNMFSDFHGPSFANNMYEVAAQAGRYDPALEYRSAWNIPHIPGSKEVSNCWGCDSPPNAVVGMLGPD